MDSLCADCGHLRHNASCWYCYEGVKMSFISYPSDTPSPAFGKCDFYSSGSD